MQINGGTRRILLWSVVGLGLLGTSGARAQALTGVWQPSSSPPEASVQLTDPWLLPGEPAGTAELSPWVGSTQRLSFQGGVPHRIGVGVASCVSLEDPAGGARGFPLRRFTSVRLSPMLVLQGFANAGCPVERPIGGLTNALSRGISLGVTSFK
jgi:hypothetical protein